MECCDDDGGTTLGGSRAQARRQRVIDTARTLFADHGFHATGVAEIARQSGVAVGQIYRDFASKEAIVASIVERDCGALLDPAALSRALAAGDEGAVRAWIAQVVDPGDAGDGRLFAEIVAESVRNERMAAIFRSVNDDVRANMAAALGIFAPGPEAADRRAVLTETILTLALGLLHRPLLTDHRADDALVASLQRMIDHEIERLRAGDAVPGRLPATTPDARPDADGR